MSGSKLNLTITATDRTAQAIDAVAKRLAGVTAPVTKVTKSLARLSDASGVTRLSKAITHLGGTAVQTSERFVGALAPLGALTAALSVAGFGKMVSDWARFSQSLGFDAARIGVGVSQLHALEGSAQLAGSSAEAAAGGLRNLQDVMVDTVGGRNNEALVYFRQLGIAFDDGAGHALRATEVLPKLADAIAGITVPSLQARVATQFFGGAAESLLPWLRRGSRGMAEYAALAKQYGVETEDSTGKATAFQFAQTRLALAFKGLGNSISSEVSPPLSRLMTFLADLANKYRPQISATFGEWARRFEAWGKSVDWERVGTKIKDIAESVASITASLASGNIGDAWRKFMDMLGLGSGSGGVEVTSDGKIVMPRPEGVESDSPPLTPSQHTDVGKLMMDRFEGKGWGHEDAAAIVSGLDRESGLRAGVTGDNGQAQGIAQLHPDRQAQFNAWSKSGGTPNGVDIRNASIDDQIRFIDWDLTEGKYKRVGDHMKAAKTLDEKVAIFDREYESPADTAGAIRNDIPRARRWAELAPTEAAPTRDEPAPASTMNSSLRARLEMMARSAREDAHLGPRPEEPLRPPGGDRIRYDLGGNVIDTGSSKHEVVIKVQAAPGTQASAVATGTGPAKVRVERSMAQ